MGAWFESKYRIPAIEDKQERPDDDLDDFGKTSTVEDDD